PKVGRRRRGVEPAAGLTLRRAVFQRLARGISGAPHAPRKFARARCDVRLPSGLARRCVVKVRYVSLTSGGAKAARAHLAYIERDGVERDGSQGRMFDADGDVQRE